LTSRILREDDTVLNHFRQVDPSLPDLVLEQIDEQQRHHGHWAHRIVSSNLDADRIDYMLRDSQQAGIQGHGFDLSRLLDNLFASENNRVVVDVKAIQCIEAFLLMNVHLYQIAYFHHTARAATFLLTSVIRRALDLWQNGDRKVFTLATRSLAVFIKELTERGSNIGLSTYMGVGENHFWTAFDEWRSHPDRILADLSSRLINRRPFKTIELHAGIAGKAAIVGARAPAIVAKAVGVSQDDAETYYLSVEEPSRMAYKLYQPSVDGAGENSIWVRNQNGAETTIENMTENNVIRSLIHREFFPRVIVPPEARDQVATFL
jgi:HD superfamily phosphohydrolase